MVFSTSYLVGVLIVSIIVAIIWVFLFYSFTKCVSPKKATHQSLLVGGFGHLFSFLNISMFFLFGIPFRKELPTMCYVMYVVSVHVMLFFLFWNCQRRNYFLKVSPSCNSLGTARNLFLLFLFTMFSLCLFLIHPLPWFNIKHDTFGWLPFAIQVYFVFCNIFSLRYVWVLLRTDKYDIYEKKRKIGTLEKQGDEWIETFEVEIPKVVVLENEIKKPLD